MEDESLKKVVSSKNESLRKVATSENESLKKVVTSKNESLRKMVTSKKKFTSTIGHFENESIRKRGDCGKKSTFNHFGK